MRTFIVYFFIFSILMSLNCAVYKISSYNYDDKISETYITKPIYTGIGATVPNMILDLILLPPSLFYPFPYIESSDMTVFGGMDLKKYLRNTFGPKGRVFPRYLVMQYGGVGTPWVSFTDSSGKAITISGKPFKIEQITKGVPFYLWYPNEKRKL